MKHTPSIGSMYDLHPTLFLANIKQALIHVTSFLLSFSSSIATYNFPEPFRPASISIATNWGSTGTWLIGVSQSEYVYYHCAARTVYIIYIQLQ